MKLFLLLVLFASGTAIGQSVPPKAYPLWKFDAVAGTCSAKGRLQDQEYCVSKLMDRIVADRKDAIPVLISQITDTTHRTEKPLFDYWGNVYTGDVAVFVLDDLFTDADWTTFTMPDTKPYYASCPQEPAWQCWDTFVKKHGRKFIQNQWRNAWNTNKNRIYWDDKARCFRIKEK